MYLTGFFKLGYKALSHREFNRGLQLKSLEKTLEKYSEKKDYENAATQSDGSTLSSKVRTRSKNNTKDDEDTSANASTAENDDSDSCYHCKLCTFSESDSQAFAKHYSTKHSKQVYFCQVIPCLKWVNTSAGLRNHCKNYHADVLSCDSCGLVSLSPVQKNAHMDTHVNAKFTCNACNRNCTRTDDGRHHFKYSCPNNPNRVIKCKHCVKSKAKTNEVAGAEPGLMAHLKDEHDMSGNYLCINCHTLFEKSKAIKAHRVKCSKTHPEGL